MGFTVIIFTHYMFYLSHSPPIIFSPTHTRGENQLLLSFLYLHVCNIACPTKYISNTINFKKNS